MKNMQCDNAMKDFEADFPNLDLEKDGGKYICQETARYFAVYVAARSRYLENYSLVGDIWGNEDTVR